jgi:uncharacterized protein
LCLLVLFIVSGCNNKKYPNPTDEFYVNDFAYAYHPYLRDMVVYEGERLYKDTRDIKTIGGAQIVFATFTIENINDIANYNLTDLFRQWRIGKNDMGILVVMFYTESVENDITYVTLEQTQIEVGYRMEQYFTAGKQGALLDKTIYSESNYDLDYATAYLYYEIITLVYDIYDVTFTYNMDDFMYDLESYVYIPSSNNGILDFLPISYFIYIFSPYSTIWEKIFIIILGLFFLGGGGFIIKSRNKGGGGSSGGYGIFRRK